jgi:hypothetical protein
VVIDLAEHTVTGFVTNTGIALIAHIDRVEDTRIDFTGGSMLGGASLVVGTIDRATGAATAHATTLAKDEPISARSYYLACKATSQPF